MDEVCQRLSEVLAPDNADADRIRQIMDEAVVEVLGEGAFDPARLDPEAIFLIMREFLSQTLFQDIVEEAGGAWDSAPDERRGPDAERQLLELIRVVVDERLAARMSRTDRIDSGSVKRFLRETVVEVWAEWEGFE